MLTARNARRWFVWLLVAYTLWLALLVTFQESLIFPGRHRTPSAGVEPPPGVQRLWIDVADSRSPPSQQRARPDPQSPPSRERTTADPQSAPSQEPSSAGSVRVEAWFQPGAGRSPDATGPAVIFLHGNKDLLEERWNVAGPYLAAGISFLACEYRGYGRSGGAPSEAALVADATRWYDWLAARPEVDRQRIIAHGISLGGGVAVGLAGRRPVAALVLESTFSSVTGLAARLLVPAPLVRHPFRSDRILAQLDVPVLLVHGRRDIVIPASHSRRLARLAARSTLVETDAGHDDYRTEWPAVWEFLRAQGLVPPGQRK
jgi:fermentation-respiration switch protein FrsA (DUF1100 family)